MKRYQIAVNGRIREVKATRTSVAVHRALDWYAESELTPCCNVSVRCLGSVKYSYVVTARVPCEPRGATMSKRVTELFDKKEVAENAAKALEIAHPEWSLLNVHKVDKD